MKLKSKIIIISLLAIILTLTLAVRHPEVQWRVAVLKLKLTGKLLPQKTWKKIFVSIKPFSDKQKIRDNYKFMIEGPAIYRGFEIGNDGMCNTLWDTPVGPFRDTCWGFHTINDLLKEQLEDKIYDLDSAGVKQGDVVIDVGAHIGTFTGFALKKGARLVIAFEPDPIYITLFKKNFEEEIRSKKVLLIEAAAWDSTTNLTFNTMSNNPLQDHEQGESVVSAVTIDNTIMDLELDNVDFIKMDIEGAERNAVAGASKTISRFKPKMALCTYHLPDDPEVISSLVFSAYPGYKIQQTELVAFFFDEKKVSPQDKKVEKLRY
jgi:FkbM family methyltransferase